MLTYGSLNNSTSGGEPSAPQGLFSGTIRPIRKSVQVMITRISSALALCAAVVSVTACEVTKSSNPLTPTVQGPIPGVNITAPTVVAPTAGTKIAVDKQPITLMVNNASTNGVRPLSYVFEVASAANFRNKGLTRDAITPGRGQ